MKPLLLTDIIQAVQAQCTYSGDLAIGNVSTDTRTIQPGDLFIALAGEKFDAHDYIDVAEQNGAAAVMVSRPVNCGLPQLLVDDTLRGLHRLAAYYRRLLNIKVVGITGSNGKTSTRDMTATVLSSKYKVYSTAKNFNNEIGLPKSVLELDDSYDIAVLEMGMNHFGEISRLTHIAGPDVALITNVGKAHIGNLGSQENILKAKLEILEGLSKDGLLILNGDDALLKSADTGRFEKSFIGINGEGLTLQAKNITMDGGINEFDIAYDGHTIHGTLPVLGNYNVLNALEAIRTGLHFGITVEEALAALSTYRVVGMRQEEELLGGVTLVKDYYNASPDSCRVALETLGSHAKGGKKIAVLGGMLELGDYAAAEHRALAEMCVKNGIAHAFFIGENSKAFSEGMPAAQVFTKAERAELADALKAFLENGGASDGDAILIKGSRGMKMEEFYEVLKENLP